MKPEELAEMLRAARLAAGLSLARLGERMNMHYTYLSHIEAARRNPTLETIGKWAEACDRTLVVRLEER